MSDELLPKKDQESYLGDGLYVSFDGYAIKLRAPREHEDHWVALEPEVYHAMLRWIARYSALWEHFARAAR